MVLTETVKVLLAAAPRALFVFDHRVFRRVETLLELLFAAWINSGWIWCDLVRLGATSCFLVGRRCSSVRLNAP